MRDANVEQPCGQCLGQLRPLRQVPVLRSLAGKRIFECTACGQLTLVAPHEAAPTWWRRGGAGLLIEQ